MAMCFPDHRQVLAWLSTAEYDWFLPVVILFVFIADIIFSATAFNCSLVHVYDNGEFEQFGFWHLKDPATGGCSALEFVGSAHRWGRAFGVMGSMLGWSLWSSICLMCLLGNVPDTWWVWSGIGMWIMLFFSSSLSWIGLGTQTCTDLRCGLTGDSRLLIVSSCIWFIVGLILIRWQSSEVIYPRSGAGKVQQTRSFLSMTSMLGDPDEENSQLSSLRKIIEAVVRKEEEREAQEMRNSPAERSKRDDYRSRVKKLLDSFHTLDEESASASSGLSGSSREDKSETDSSSSPSPSDVSSVGSLPTNTRIRLLPQQVERSKNVDGSETVTTTKTTLHPDGTRVIEKNTVQVIPPTEPTGGCGVCVTDLCYINDDDSEEEAFDDGDDTNNQVDTSSAILAARRKRPSKLPRMLPARKDRKGKSLRPSSGGSLVESVVSVQPSVSTNKMTADALKFPKSNSKEDMVILGVEHSAQTKPSRGWPWRPSQRTHSGRMELDAKASEEEVESVHNLL